MVLFENLTKENVAHYAAVVYNNPHFTRIEQFQHDLRKVSIIKKQMNRFDLANSKEEKQSYADKIINNSIVFINTFGTESALRILFTLMEDRFQRKLASIVQVIYADAPEIVPGVHNTDIILEYIEPDSVFRDFIQSHYKGMVNNVT